MTDNQNKRKIWTAATYLEEAGLARRSDPPYSLKLLFNGTKNHPDCPQLWHVLAKRLRDTLSRDDDAMHCFERAYELDPQDVRIVMDFATFLVRKAGYERAEILYMGLLAKEGESSRVLCALGHQYQKRQEDELALAAFHRAFKLNPHDGIAVRRYVEMVHIVGREVNDNDYGLFEARKLKTGGNPAPAPFKQDIDNTPVKRP